MANHAADGKQPELTLSRLPPLTALRAFTAAARHLSFIRAAEELHVTPAAVGQHVRQLEAHFGRSLFLRNRGQLELTETGRTLFPGLEQAFETVLASVSQVGQSDGDFELRIAAPTSFISKWLIPRLKNFRALVPNVRIVLQRDDEAVGSEHSRADCAIRTSRDGALGHEADYLFQEELIPVCTPSYQIRYGLHANDFGLDRVTLLEEVRQDCDSLYPGWEKWLRINCFDPPVSLQRMRFADSSMVIDAALAGEGIGLTSLRLAQHDLTAGRLVVPFGVATPVRDAYFFLAFGTVAASSPVATVRRWLVHEAAVARGFASNHAASGTSFLIAAE